MIEVFIKQPFLMFLLAIVVILGIIGGIIQIFKDLKKGVKK